jgi:RNA polymerase sigma-70 factor (ECF subfamily)
MHKTARAPNAEQTVSMTDGADQFSNVLELQMPVIYRFLLASLGDRELAETLTQECLLKAYRHRSSFRGESSTRTWLMRIAINLQKDYWRSRRLRFWRETQANAVDVESVGDYLPSRERSPEALVAAREQAALIWEAMQILSIRERSVFLLRFVKDLQLGEIGQSTGLKVGAVKAYLARAVAKIRRELGEKRRSK